MNLSGMISDEVIEAILEIFKQEHPSGVYVVSKMLNGNVLIEGESDQSLYLRPFPAQTLTLSRISTLRSRKGIGKAILDVLEKTAKEHGCSQLVLEQVMTEDMHRFAKKHGFEEDPLTMMTLGDQRVGNYTKAI